MTTASTQAAMEAEAHRALRRYPWLMTAGVEFTCLEEVGRRWRIISAAHPHPQDGRDELAHWLRTLAGDAPDPGLIGELRTAYELLDREVRDEVRTGGRRYRVGRLERFVRTGEGGPETPRPSDPESPAGARRPPLRRALGFLHANALTGTTAAVVRYAMRYRVPDGTTPEMTRDAVRALDSYPRVLLLPAEYLIAEEVDGAWRSAGLGLAATPQAARDALSDYFLRVIPGPDSADPGTAHAAVVLKWRSPGPAACARYRVAADRLVGDRLDDISVADRHFRVVRVEQAVRAGADGPEPPRPSDPDPYGPPAAQP